MSEDISNKIDFFKDIFSNIGKKPVIVCLGNDLRNDDGIGPYIARNIKNNKFKIIDAGQVFENYIYDIINYRPTDIIIIDAAFFGGSTGDVSLIGEDKISCVKMVSTHALPLTHILDIIKAELNNVNIYIIGIQISNTGFGEDISDSVKKVGDDIINYINSI